MPIEETPPICHRCGTLLTLGRGDFYVVRIEAYADDSPPVITREDLAKDHAAEMAKIGEELRSISPQEAMDAVHRRMTLHLCRGCYRVWIERPTG